MKIKQVLIAFLVAATVSLLAEITGIGRFKGNSPEAPSAEELFRQGWNSYNSDTDNYAKAFRDFTASAEAGNPDAQEALATMYDQGIGCAQNYALAFQWYEKSADQGNSEAQFELGVYYDNGFVIPRNGPLALAWILRSADQNNADAEDWLGFAYYEGYDLLTQNYSRSVYWYKKAAAQGDSVAKLELPTAELWASSSP